MLLITLGDPGDLCSALLGAKAEAMGLLHIHCDEDEFGKQWSVLDKSNDSAEQHLVIDNDTYPTSNILFFPRFRSTPEIMLAADDQEVSHALIRERRSALHTLLIRSHGPVINLPYTGLANGAKPLQMQQLSKFGFSVPDWLVSNNWKAISTLQDQFTDGAIYKSVSGLRSQVRRLTRSEQSLFETSTPPVLVQEYIAGYDVRAHTIGNEVVATRISGSDQVDYRWSDQRIAYNPIDPPREICSLMCAFAREQNMILAGFDFRVDENNQWHCLEMNPAPTFATYEIGAHQPISEYILCAGLDHVAAA